VTAGLLPPDAHALLLRYLRWPRPMHRLCTTLGILAAAVTVACADTSPPSGPQNQTPYAVVYGHIGAPVFTTNITVYIVAYSDSAQAVAGGSAGFDGSFAESVDTANDYIAPVPSTAPGTYYLDVLATGQGRSGFVSSIDTIRAIRVHFDSIGGTMPHDSVMVDDSLP
jgi:hypothetical protein